MTEWGVQLYFGGRVIYLALYSAGVFLLRSLVWNIATLGIALILLSLASTNGQTAHCRDSILHSCDQW